MPSTLSTLRNRIYGREWSFPYNCYEIGHWWTPNCSEAALGVGLAAFKNSLPLYSSLYFFTQLGLQRKYDVKSFLETGKSIWTSCFFLGFNLMAGMTISCVLRNSSDRYYYRIQCLLPAFLASLLSIYIERPNRRPALAFYLANMASEVIFKWIISRGHMRPLPHGETILFALGMACWLRHVRVHGFSHDPVSTALKYLIGPLEAKSRAKKSKPTDSFNDNQVMALTENCNETNDSEYVISTQSQQQVLNNAQQQKTEQSDIIIEHQMKRRKKPLLTLMDEGFNEFLNKFFNCYHVCPHKGISCLNYTLTPSLTRFIWGYLGRSALNLVGKYRIILKQPGQALVEALKSEKSIYMGLFLATFVGSSRASHCILRRLSGQQHEWHSLIAGSISGLSMLFEPKSTLSTYVIWKCLEQYFFLAVERGQIKRANEWISFVYAISVNILLYMFAVEPSFVRPSYMKFIDGISDHRLHQINRMVLDVFGPNASVGYEDWFPNLDPKYMTREFHELIFNWLVAPH